MAEAVIDAGELLDARDGGRGKADEETGEVISGERGAADLKSGRRAAPKGARVLLVTMGAIFAIIVLVLVVKAYRMKNEPAASRAKEAAERVERRVPGLKIAPLPPDQAGRQVDRPPMVRASLTGFGGVTDPVPSQPVELSPNADPAPAETPAKGESVLERRLSRGFAAESAGGLPGGGLPTPVPDAGSPAAAPVPKGGGLEEKLEATELKATTAGMLRDRDYWLTQGAMLDCVLETKIISTVAGMTSCHLTRDVYSTNGRVVLLDRGTKLVGRYQGGGQQGENRIFVVWTRAETPRGVIVTLDSPGTGSLGEAGVGGWADQHFWDRLGTAVLVSLVQGATTAATERVAGSSAGTTVNVGGAGTAANDVVGRTFESSINRPPTVYVNQGERIGVFVARDLNFQSVYGIEPVAHRDE